MNYTRVCAIHFTRTPALSEGDELVLTNLGEMALDFAALLDPTPASVLSEETLGLCRASYFSAGLDMLGTVPVMGEEAKLGLILNNFSHYESTLRETEILVAELRRAGRDPKLLEAIRRVCFAIEQTLAGILRIWEQILRPAAASYIGVSDLRHVDQTLHAIEADLRPITAKASQHEPALGAPQLYPAVLKREIALKNRHAQQQLAQAVRHG